MMLDQGRLAQLLGEARVLVPYLSGSFSILNIKIWVVDMISKSPSKSKFIKMKFKWHFENYNLYVYNFYHRLSQVALRVFEGRSCVREREWYGCLLRHRGLRPSPLLTSTDSFQMKPQMNYQRANMGLKDRLKGKRSRLPLANG